MRKAKVKKIVLDRYGSFLGMEKGCFVVRDKKGRLVTWKKWKPTEPIEKAKYIEVPFDIDAETGREARQKIMEFYKQWEWVPGTFRVDY